MVDGTVTSTLTDCIVKENAFGGGYKAESEEVLVYPTTKPVLSVYTKETGIFSDFGTVEPETWTWQQADDSHAAGTNDSKNKYLYTGTTMADLGNVTGKITLTIDGDSKIGYDENGNRSTQADSGNVFGGGNESKSLNNTEVILKDNTEVGGNVFGGGNQADVSGSATVNIE